jgi:hypothetical protein
LEITQESIIRHFPWLAALLTFLGCWLVSIAVRQPVPRIHDEFSYILMGETLAQGRAANPSPPLPEFFDTFHVLVTPHYVSKYFPAQGIFLAVGEKLGGHPAIGIWLSSAVFCAALVWMLQAWVSPVWGGWGINCRCSIRSFQLLEPDLLGWDGSGFGRRAILRGIAEALG